MPYLHSLNNVDIESAFINGANIPFELLVQMPCGDHLIFLLNKKEFNIHENSNKQFRHDVHRNE